MGKLQWSQKKNFKMHGWNLSSIRLGDCFYQKKKTYQEFCSNPQRASAWNALNSGILWIWKCQWKMIFLKSCNKKYLSEFNKMLNDKKKKTPLITNYKHSDEAMNKGKNKRTKVTKLTRLFLMTGLSAPKASSAANLQKSADPPIGKYSWSGLRSLKRFSAYVRVAMHVNSWTNCS